MRKDRPTFEAGLLGDVKGTVCLGDGILSEAAVWGHHFVKCSDAVARVELDHIGAHGVHGASDVIARIHGLV